MSQQTSVAAEVLQAFAAYETALIDNDVAAMQRCFWDSEELVRFGVADEQWGARQLRIWRAAASPVPSGRTLGKTQVAVFGPATAVVTTLFCYPGNRALGRQSQTWVCFDGDWRIVSAHVSERAATGP